MTKINLLPPEIAEKRKTEKMFLYIISAGIFIIIIIVLVYSAITFQEMKAKRELDKLVAENIKLEEDIKKLQVFEERKKEWEAYQAIYKSAINYEVLWSKVINSLSMVIPSDSWITKLDASFDDGIIASGQSPYYEEIEHKPIARFLIRISEISELTDVWLGFSKVTLGGADKIDLVEFEAKAKLQKALDKIAKEEAQANQTPAPAPPAQ